MKWLTFLILVIGISGCAISAFETKPVFRDIDVPAASPQEPVETPALPEQVSCPGGRADLLCFDTQGAGQLFVLWDVASANEEIARQNARIARFVSASRQDILELGQGQDRSLMFQSWITRAALVLSPLAFIAGVLL